MTLETSFAASIVRWMKAVELVGSWQLDIAGHMQRILHSHRILSNRCLVLVSLGAAYHTFVVVSLAPGIGCHHGINEAVVSMLACAIPSVP